MADRRVDVIEHIASIARAKSRAQLRCGPDGEGRGGGEYRSLLLVFPPRRVTGTRQSKARVAPALHTPQAIGRGPESRETRATTERAGEPRGVAGMAYDERAGAIEVRPARAQLPHEPGSTRRRRHPSPNAPFASSQTARRTTGATRRSSRRTSTSSIPPSRRVRRKTSTPSARRAACGSPVAIPRNPPAPSRNRPCPRTASTSSRSAGSPRPRPCSPRRGPRRCPAATSYPSRRRAAARPSRSCCPPWFTSTRSLTWSEGTAPSCSSSRPPGSSRCRSRSRRQRLASRPRSRARASTAARRVTRRSPR